MTTKQNKVLNKIDKKTGTSDKLAAAKEAKYDEFYTSLQDIMNELTHWGEKLKGKNIICPCDCDIFDDEDVYSITIEFNETAEPCVYTKTWTINKVKKVIYRSLFFEDQPLKETVVTDEEAQELIKTRLKCNFLNALCSIGQEYGIKSITASGYNVNTLRGIKFQDVDYSHYDVCITNPPFSIYGEFLDLMLKESEKRKSSDNKFDFLVLAPMMNRVTPSIGLPLMLKQIYLGFGRNIGMNFTNPDKEEHLKSKVVNVDWITTWPDAQDLIIDDFNTGVNYDLYKDEFKETPFMTMKDGTHPIQIKSKEIIPDNYYGWMFGSVGILNKLSYDKYEWYITNAKGYFNKTNPEANPFNHKLSNDMMNVDGKQGFHGIVFRRKVK